MRGIRRLSGYLPALLAVLCACASETPNQRVTDNRGAGTGAIGPAGSPAMTAGSPGLPRPNDQPGLAGMPALIVDSGPPADAAAGCTGTSVTAPPTSTPKVDIVW